MQKVCVGCRENGRYVHATESISKGEIILELTGEFSEAPTRYSIQLGEFEHLSPHDTAFEDGSADGPLCWVYTNHSCEPNACVRDRCLVAIRPIAIGEELTFDYETTEVEMAEPFLCGCNSDQCRGTIRGFRHLNHEYRVRLMPLLAPYLASEVELCGEEVAQ